MSSIEGLKGLFPLLPDVLPADTFEVAIQCLAHALGKGNTFHCYVVFERSTKVPEIAQRQDALKKLRAAHKVISVEVMQRHPSGDTRAFFSTEIDWLNASEAHLSSEETLLDEDRTTAELASRESRVMFYDTTCWFST